MFLSRQFILGVLALSNAVMLVSAAPHGHGHKRGCKPKPSSSTSALPPSSTGTDEPTPSSTLPPSSTDEPTPTSTVTLPPSTSDSPAPTSTSTPAPPPPSGGCFPFGNATLSDSTPAQYGKRDDWWCPASEQYGFMGFSYPLEDSNCDAESNSAQKISNDFKRMKAMGARLVRVYAPECRKKSVWENLLKAGIENDMGIIGLVWWGFQADQSLWKKTRDSLLAVIQENPLAPYVFHSIAFGSEPILDHVDGNNFVKDMQAFKKQLEPFGIPLAISEAWDLGDLTRSNKLTNLGKQIRDTSDLVQAHMMPYYHCDKYPNADNVMDFFTHYIEKLIEPNFNGMPILITETQWASTPDSVHNRGCKGQDLGNFKTYWNTFIDNCEYWKEHKVGWFAHVFSDGAETGFGILAQNGKAKMAFNPQRC